MVILWNTVKWFRETGMLRHYIRRRWQQYLQKNLAKTWRTFRKPFSPTDAIKIVIQCHSYYFSQCLFLNLKIWAFHLGSGQSGCTSFPLRLLHFLSDVQWKCQDDEPVVCAVCAVCAACAAVCRVCRLCLVCRLCFVCCIKRYYLEILLREIT